MIVNLSMTKNGYSDFIKDYPGLIWLAFVLEIAAMCAVLCNKTLARSVPVNYILLLIFTLALSYIVGFITTVYEPMLVLKAAFITLIITIALTLYALTTSHDLTYGCGAIWIFSAVFTTFMLFVFIVKGNTNNTLYSLVWAVLYGFYLIHDT